MSNLDFTISMLTFVLFKISQPQPASFKIVKERFDIITGINRALNILKEEKIKDERNKKEKLLKQINNIKL